MVAGYTKAPKLKAFPGFLEYKEFNLLYDEY